jgi:hypothetical protein
MACPECWLEQAVADAGICARCGAPLPGAGHPSGTFTDPGGAELRVDSSGRCEAQPMRSASETMIPSGPRT